VGVALEPHFRRARQAGTVELTELDEGMLHWGLLAAAHRLPFLPIRAGLGSDVLEVNPELRTVRSPYADPFGLGEELVAMPALRLDAALVHMNRADAAGNGQYLGPNRTSTTCSAWLPSAPTCRASGSWPRSTGRRRPCCSTGSWCTASRKPERRALHQLRPGLRPRRGVPGSLRGGRRRLRGLGEVPGRIPGR